MKHHASRRGFLRKSLAVTVAVPLAVSLEESHLMAQEAQTGGVRAPTPNAKAACPSGKIGKVTMSRIICGGNLISGYAHSRDLIYVSRLLKAYHTQEKIMETWALCEEHGINTMIFNPSDPNAVETLDKYRQIGGKIQYLAQLAPSPNNLSHSIKAAADAGAVGALLVGNYGDAWTRDNKVDLIEKFLAIVKEHGMISGVAAHELRTIRTVDKAGLKADFFMKTLHTENYWSKRRPDQTKEIIDNYSVDNYWCLDPAATVNYMAEVNRPWVAYKVLAAGAVNPNAGFKYAFESGADFCIVGMFDFQVAENVQIAARVIKAAQNRERAWMA